MLRVTFFALTIIILGSFQCAVGQASDKTKRNFGIKERSMELHACSDAAKSIERKALSYKGIKKAVWNPHTHVLMVQYDVFHTAYADSLQQQLPVLWADCGHHIASSGSGRGVVCSCR